LQVGYAVLIVVGIGAAVIVLVAIRVFGIVGAGVVRVDGVKPAKR
jgi:hypothetical protein